MGQDYYCKLRYSLTKAFDLMNDNEVASIVRSMLHFMQDMPLPDIAQTEKALICWTMIEKDLIQDKEDRDNGRKGGRPRTNTQDKKPFEGSTEDPKWL